MNRKPDPFERDLPGAEQENVENFSLSDFYQMGWDTFEAKTQLFSPYFNNMLKDGFIMREATGAAGAHTQVSGHDVLMFGSNNYLGLANEPFVVERTIEAIRKYGIGCGGPPLLNGYTALHRELEERLAALKHCEAACLFSSGYAANVGWTTGLFTANDVLIYDAQSHASLFDGIKMGRFESVHFNHNDLDHLRKRLMQARWKHAFTNVVVCVEGVYSMDGDIAPLPEIRKLCDKYDALLAIDDAHGTGVLGKTGSGTSEHFGMEGKVDIVMGTFSKIFAVTGGFIAGAQAMVDYLRFFSRSYMFSASLPPPLVASVLAGIDFLRDHPERVSQLHDNVAYLVKGLREIGFEVNVETAIIPIFVPVNVSIRKVVARLQDEGVFVNGVEYPAVPKARQRLRLSVMATFSRADLDFAIDKLRKVGLEFGILEGKA